MKTIDKLDTTWEQCKLDPAGTVYYEETYEDYIFIILNTGYHLCAYFGVSLNSPLAGVHQFDIPLHPHGGVSFSSSRHELIKNKNYWWIGWDYGHCDDLSFDDNLNKFRENAKAWTPQMVFDDCDDVQIEFIELIRFTKAVTDNLFCKV